MKTELLKELGLAQDAIDKIMAENGKDVEAVKAQAETLKAQLNEVNGKLKTFEGVDVNALKEQVAALQQDLTAKQTEYSAQLADRDFQAALSAGVLAAKGKNPKAVMALLDTEKLKVSKNQKEDIAAAIETLKTSDAYLFGEETKAGEKTPAKVSTGGTHGDGGSGDTGQSAINDMMNAAIRGKPKGD